MQWGQIKTLFIVAFLILNVFLIKQLVDRQEEELSFIPEASKEEELELNVNGLDDLNDESFEAPLLYTQNFDFNTDIAGILDLDDQEIVISDRFYLYSRFVEPKPLNLDDPTSVRDYINQYVYRGNEYEFFRYFGEENLLVFFQRVEHPIFYNQNAVLFIQLNEEEEMVRYYQSYLALVDEDHDEESQQTLINQYDAVYRLYHNSNVIETGDTVTDVILGFHNIVSLPNGEQLLNPTWQIRVNDTEDFYMNAIEGHDYPSQESFFIDALNTFSTQLNQANNREIIYYHQQQTVGDTEYEPLIDSMREAIIEIKEQLTEVELE